MPMPKLMAHINKRVFNPMELRRGKRPVLRHVGRNSGRTYRTPLDAHAIDGGYLFILVYGSDSDWAQNILRSGEATLEVGGREIELIAPKVIDGETAFELLPPEVKKPANIMNIDEYLQMDLANDRQPASN